MKKNEEKLEFICDAKIYYDANKETYILDIRDTECSPDKARKILKILTENRSINIKLPSLIEK